MPHGAALASDRGRSHSRSLGRLHGLHGHGLLLEQLGHQARDRGAPRTLSCSCSCFRFCFCFSLLLLLAEGLEHGRGTQRRPASLRPLQA